MPLVISKSLSIHCVHCPLYKCEGMFLLLLESSLTREQGVTMRDSIPVLALQLFCLQKPGSITQMMPSMVRDVSAIFVATTTCSTKTTNHYPRNSQSEFWVFINMIKKKKNIYIRICILFVCVLVLCLFFFQIKSSAIMNKQVNLCSLPQTSTDMLPPSGRQKVMTFLLCALQAEWD